jgi:hypothetical protein
MTATRKPRLRDRLRPYLLGTASLFDLSGALTYREARRALPPAGDRKAVGDHFREAGRLLREAMNEVVAPPAVADEDEKPEDSSEEKNDA